MLVFEQKLIFAALTLGICKQDGDCHKLNPGMDCVRHIRTVFSRVHNGKLLVYYNEKPTEGGKCTLGKISQITI